MIKKLKKERMEKIKGYATKVPSKAKALQTEVKKNILKAVLAAFAFVIALVWRDAIRAGVDEIIKRAGIEGTGYVYQITMAFNSNNGLCCRYNDCFKSQRQRGY